MNDHLFLEKTGLTEGELGFIRRQPLKLHTTFQIGGEAEIFAQPCSRAAFMAALRAAREMGLPLHIIGRGSNLLVQDEGVAGVVLCTCGMSGVRVEGECIIAEAGASMKQMALAALEAGLTGAEFAAGIPGTIGGGVFMNAGAYGGQMENIVTRSVYVDGEGEIGSLHAEQHAFGYRKSAYKENPDHVILEAEFRLQPGNPAAIRAKMNDFARRRREKQPLNFPSAGSVFKRPEGKFAGQLIENAGLKGKTIGGAQVSEKHAGFIINQGDATCADVTALIAHIQKTVYDMFGVHLECEVRTIG